MDVLVSFKTCLKSFDARKWWSCCNKLQVCRDIYNTTLPPIIMEWSGKMGLWKMSLVRSTAPDQPAIAVLALAHLKMKISDLRFEILYANRDHDIIWICISPYNIYIYIHMYIYIYIWVIHCNSMGFPHGMMETFSALRIFGIQVQRSPDEWGYYYYYFQPFSDRKMYTHTHILYYIILYYIILYYVISYYIILYYIILYMIYMRIYT